MDFIHLVGKDDYGQRTSGIFRKSTIVYVDDTDNAATVIFDKCTRVYVDPEFATFQDIVKILTERN